MSPNRTIITSDFNICPLTFWNIYQSAGALIGSMLEQDATYQRWVGRSRTAQAIARALVLPAYYHLTTSGYGAFAGEEMAGWLYLRGWRQLLYIDTVATSPAWRKQGVGKAFLDFAEAQARELHRQWLGLMVTASNEAAIRLYEKQGFQRVHWRVMSRADDPNITFGDTQDIRLRPVFGLAAQQAYHRFLSLDLVAGDTWVTPVVPHLLDFDLHRGWGQEWLVIVDGQAVAYLNKHGSPANPNLYLASGPDWWGHSQVLRAIGLALSRSVRNIETITLRLGSSGHHDAALSTLSEIGFTSHPARQIKMLKYLGDNTTITSGERARS